MSAKLTVKSQLAFTLILLFATAAMLSGCGSTENYYIDPEYQDQKSTSPVLVIPVQKDWFSNNIEHPFGHLNRKDGQAFNSLINPIFSEYAGSMITVVTSGEGMDDDNFRIMNLPIGNIQRDIIVPTEQADFNTSNSNPRFVLILDQFYFRKLTNTTSNSGYAGHGDEIKQRLLYFYTIYVYWDTVKQKPIAWGESESNISYSDTISNADYSKLLEKVLKKIISRGPIL